MVLSMAPMQEDFPELWIAAAPPGERMRMRLAHEEMEEVTEYVVDLETAVHTAALIFDKLRMTRAATHMRDALKPQQQSAAGPGGSATFPQVEGPS